MEFDLVLMVAGVSVIRVSAKVWKNELQQPIYYSYLLSVVVSQDGRNSGTVAPFLQILTLVHGKDIARTFHCATKTTMDLFATNDTLI